jgi:transposase
MAQIEVISGVERRRRWTLEEKQTHLARAFAPGVKVTAYARQADVATSLLYDWRRSLGHEATGNAGFVSVVALTDNEVLPGGLREPIARMPMSGLSLTPREPVIELEVRGHKIRVPGNIPPSLATAVIQALVRR